MADKNRRIITLPYGEGLDRATGVMVVRPTSFDDIRNMFLFQGKAQVRNGILTASVLQDDGPTDLDVTLLLEPLRSLGQSVGVGYNTGNREVWLNRLEIDGSAPVVIEPSLGTLGGDATFTPPIIVGADSDNKFFIAHDEPKFTARFPTQIFDPEDFPQLSNLTADLDGNGDAPVFFRGVVRHLSYIFGWGFGSASDPVRGDVVRVSNSGNSAEFEDFAFFEVGQQGETVMVCRSAGPSLMVFKETETYEIFGYSPDTFGVRLADSLFGCVGSRLAVSVAGNVFFWSTQGPRVTTGGPSQDIAVPLDIDGPDPLTLVAESEPQDAFAAYDPRTRVVKFVWGRRVYALSIRDPSQPRWSYYELAERAQCSGLFFSTQSQAGGGGPPIGAPEIDTFDEEARGTLTIEAGNANNNETVLVNNKQYVWQTVLTDIDGNVLIGASAQDSADNLIAAIVLGAGAGVVYAASMTINSDMTAGPGTDPATVEASGRLGQGFASNGKPLQETMASGQWNSPVTIDGIGQTATFVEFFVSNIDPLGGEDIEIHVSDDGGTDYTFTGRVPFDGSVPPDRQKITVTLESRSTGRKIQPLTDYKFSVRYVLGGQFSPGYTDPDPDTWPAVSQGIDTTTSDPIQLGQRPGQNEGLWEELNSVTHKINIVTGLPIGHELIDIEVFREVQAAGPVTRPDGFPSLGPPLPPPPRGQVIQASQLDQLYNATSPGFPLRYEDEYVGAAALPAPQTEFLNVYKMRYRNGGNTGPFSEDLECFLGPDEPPPGSITSAFWIRVQIIVIGVSFRLSLNWNNTQTPDGSIGSGGLRTCPAPTATSVPPSGHSTSIWARDVDHGQFWEFITRVGPNVTNVNNLVIPFADFPLLEDGDEVHIAIRHSVRCFGGIFGGGREFSEWGIQGGDQRYITVFVQS